jgi:hypothetical protein
MFNVGDLLRVDGTGMRGTVRERREMEIKPGIVAAYVLLRDGAHEFWEGEHYCSLIKEGER